MPSYDYDCAACGRRFEVLHGVHADGPTTCPLCGKGPVRKAISAAAVHFKGSGWAKKERRSASTSGASKTAEESTVPSEGGPTKSSSTSEGGAPMSTSNSRSDGGSSEAAAPAPSKPAEAGAASSTD